MQISFGTGLSSMSSAQVALRLLNTQTVAPSPEPKAQATGSASGDIESLLSYAKKASSLAAKVAIANPVYDPAADLPEGWSMGELVSVDTLAPEYRDYATSLGATHVRLYGPDPVSDEVFNQKVSTYLDDAYGSDPAYLAAKAAGDVSISRQSDIFAKLGDSRAGEQAMAFYRGQNGSEYFGSGQTGIGSANFDSWWNKQNADGQYLAVGGTMGLNFVASWTAA
jgi:hypothetical protein